MNVLKKWKDRGNRNGENIFVGVWLPEEKIRKYGFAFRGKEVLIGSFMKKQGKVV